MIGTVMRIGWITLKRDRIAQALAYLLPIAFFSVFLMIFGQMGPSRVSRVKLAVVDEDHSEASGRFLAALENDPGLRVVRTRDKEQTPLTREEARELVVGNSGVSVAVIVKEGFAERFGGFWNPGGDGDEAHVDLLADTSDPIAPQMVMGLLQRAAMTALPDLFMERGLDTFQQYGGPLTEQQRSAVGSWLKLMHEAKAVELNPPTSLAEDAGRPQSAGGRDARAPLDSQGETGGGSQPDGRQDASSPPASPFAGGLVRVHTVDLLADAPDKSPISAFYAAGLAVMFLLFSTMATAGVLLDEEANGTLERLLVSRITMGRFLFGRWLYVTLLAMSQLTVMFLWGWAVFGVKLWTPTHLAGFFAMTLVTSAAAAGFGLVLATACRTRAQLDGLGTIIILLMSALGGSMFPRFMMPEWMRQVGLLTFNGWALDGYQKVFWYEKTVPELWPQLLVLAGLSAAFLFVSRLLARRWERA